LTGGRMSGGGIGSDMEALLDREEPSVQRPVRAIEREMIHLWSPSPSRRT
jgi:hypothetical protein